MADVKNYEVEDFVEFRCKSCDYLHVIHRDILRDLIEEETHNK